MDRRQEVGATCSSWSAPVSTGPTETVNVNTYVDVLARRAMAYRVRRYENPFEFYLEFANYPYKYETLFCDMQKYYENPKNQKNCLLVSNCFLNLFLIHLILIFNS